MKAETRSNATRYIPAIKMFSKLSVSGSALNPKPINMSSIKSPENIAGVNSNGIQCYRIVADSMVDRLSYVYSRRKLTWGTVGGGEKRRC